MKTTGRPQEIIESALRRGQSVDTIFLSWLWEDFRTLETENAELKRSIADTASQNVSLHQQNAELMRQIAHLLNEVDRARIAEGYWKEKSQEASSEVQRSEEGE